VRALLATLLAVTLVGLPGCSLGGDDRGTEGDACPSEKAFVRQQWTTDDAVRAIAVHCDTIYVAGQFESIGPRTGPFASVSHASAAAASEVPVIRSAPPRIDVTTPAPRVTGVASDGAGGWYVAGDFGFVGDRRCADLAHVLSTGDVDPALCVETDELVTAMARVGSTLYIGGGFTRVAGRPRFGLAALDVRTGSVLPWAPRLDEREVCDDHDCVETSVWAIDAGARALYVGGVFAGVNGVERTNVAALDLKSGRTLAFDAGLRRAEDYFGGVGALAVSDGTVYLSCEYCNAPSSRERPTLERFDADSGRPVGSPIPLDGPVRVLVVDGWKLYVGGSFQRIAGVRRRGLAALDAETGRLRPWSPSGIPAGVAVTAVAADKAEVHVATEDARAESASYPILALDAVNGRLSSRPVSTNGPVAAIGVFGERVVAGGTFSGVGVQRRDGIAAIDGARGVLLEWAPRTGSAEWEHPSSLLVAGGWLFVGGSLTQVDGKRRKGLAAFDLLTRRVTPWSPIVGDIGDPFFAGVVSMAADGDAIYVGGDFTTVDGVSRLGAAALGAASGEVLDWNPEAGADPGPRIELGAVRSIATAASRVYIGGEFESPRVGLFAVDGSSAELESWDPHPNQLVQTVLPSEDGIYVGGWFGEIGGGRRNALALVDRESGHATTFDARIAGDYAEVFAIAHTDAMLFVAGGFDLVAGERRAGLAALDPLTGRLLRWSLQQADGTCTPSSLATGGGALIVGRGDPDHCGDLFVEPLPEQR
jgi:hypothetical protein